MRIDQADLLEGMERSFVRKFMALTATVYYEKGDFIFHEGDKANFFYTLIEGGIRLSIGENAKEVFTVSQSGEAFGLSSILDRNYYSATAECLKSTRLHKIERNALSQFLRDHPADSMVFYKRISNRLAQRLVECYKII